MATQISATTNASVRLAGEQVSGNWAALAHLLPIVLLCYSLLLPQEMRIDFQGQSIFPYRAVIIGLLPWLMIRLLQGGLHFLKVDLLIFAASAWILCSFVWAYGPGDGVIRGTALVIDLLPPYLIGRICIRTLTDLRRVLVLLAPGIFVAGLLVLIESVSHRHIVRPIAQAVFGKLPFYANGEASGEARDFTVYRLGLLRAFGPFPQPILGGIFLATMLPLYFFSGLRKWPVWFGLIAGLCAFFTVSSAALIGIVLFFGIGFYDQVQKMVEGLNWRIALLIAGLVGLALHLASRNGIINVLIRFTLDPQTGYYRQEIWRYGSRSIANHPWFGIAFDDYERAPWMINSIDGHWLLLGVRHGLVVPVCIFAATMITIFLLALKSQHLPEVSRRTLVGVAAALFMMVFLGFTVSYFGSINLWLYLLLGLGLSIQHAIGSDRQAPA